MRTEQLKQIKTLFNGTFLHGYLSIEHYLINEGKRSYFWFFYSSIVMQ